MGVGRGVGVGDEDEGGGRTSEFLSKHSARGFVFIAPLLLLISLRGVIMLRGGGWAWQWGGQGAAGPNEK